MLALSLSDKFCCFGIFVFVFVNQNHTDTHTCFDIKNITSTPVVLTGVYPHMPIAVTRVVKDTFGSVFSNTRYKILCMYSCRIFYDNSRHRLRHRPSPRNTNIYNTGRHRPCGGLFLRAHTVVDGRASLSHRDNYHRTCYRFFNF